MSEHPDLHALLRAELANDEVLAAGDHLDGCAACRADLAELATAHALLARSGRTLGAVAPAAALAPLPPVRRRRGPALLVAAAAAVLLGAAGTTYAVLAGDDDAPRAPVAATDLDPVEGSARGRVEMAGAEAGTRMTITTEDLPPAGSGRFYEAWLLDPATNKMLPLGTLGPRGTASFEIDDALLAGYSAIDVSLEDDDGDPEHSVTSVLRATYDPGVVGS